ncbi:MAG: hypothetical protein AB7G28_26485 [Pirellulales bacterium]
MTPTSALLRKLLWSVGTDSQSPVACAGLRSVTVGELIAGTKRGELLVLQRETVERIIEELEQPQPPRRVAEKEAKGGRDLC